MHLTRESEKAMAPHSSTLAWKIPWTEEPGGLHSMGSLGVRHDWVTSLSLFTFMHWRRKWQPTPVFLPGESQGRGNLVGCRLWCRTESDTTEVTQQQQQQAIKTLWWIWLVTQKAQFSPFHASVLTKTIHSSCILMLHKKVIPLSSVAPIILLLFNFIIKYNW